MRLPKTDKLVLAVMCGVPTVLLLAFVWFPALASVGLSFTSWDGIGGVGTIEWVGTRNYSQIFSIYPPFWPALRHNLYWLAFFILIPTTFGIFLAVVLDRAIRFSRLYQSALYLPVMLSLVLVGFIAQLFYSQDQGFINGLIGQQGTGPDWLGNPDLNLWAMMIAASWRHVGYIMVLYLAGLKSVDESLRDAARVDGANEWQTFRQVIFPVLKPINVVVLVVTVIESLRAFDIVYVVNGGKNGLELLSVLVYDNIVGEASRIGYGSAIGTILLVLALGFIVTYLVQNFRREQRP
ncbi:sugar ABC transporter permease [Solirubrobacter phytolaccae]|uniref:Sugar ABC transporter permease n=1 Tax=Solirubrobacter phytolaccae TaxID=1404360 RepID=A0A9X3S991_9ACTN|nr:sugar ABC transporter permease [Solirubrobacter phytolaccae]MDA0183124.1 sugar ABC transporter permease [Solirubrobacter phytolaccae]